jgi:hypothetical protein
MDSNIINTVPQLLLYTNNFRVCGPQLVTLTALNNIPGIYNWYGLSSRYIYDQYCFLNAVYYVGYTVNGCGSVLDSIKVTVQTTPSRATIYDTICHGMTYLFHGTALHSFGIYRDTLQISGDAIAL